jgi:hypothetical protein
MTRMVLAAALALAVTLPAISAQAQSPRTFVSAAGSDSNPCSFAAPCRHFQAAVNATSAGGEVDALDPAGYGPITINQAITIEGQGWSYIAPPANGNGITVNAGSGNVAVQGVLLNGAGITGNTNGIVFNSGDSLTVQNTVIRNFTNDGLDFFPSGTPSATLAVSDSSINDNGGNGLLIKPTTTSAVKASIDRTAFYGNTLVGLAVNGNSGTGTMDVAVTDSVAAYGSEGFAVDANAGQFFSALVLTRSKAVSNGTGLETSGNDAGILLGQSTVSGNAAGFNIHGNSVIRTFGDNYLANNNNTGTLGPISKQ